MRGDYGGAPPTGVGRRGSDDIDRLCTAVKKLRHKLGDDAANPTYIFNEHDVGYPIATPGRGVGGRASTWNRAGTCQRQWDTLRD